jgi:hypothetical protein
LEQLHGARSGSWAVGDQDGGRNVASLGEITVGELREVFPQWQIFSNRGAWWAIRGGVQAWSGPETLLRRVLNASDLTVLAERLCMQEWLDGLDDEALAAVYRGALVGSAVTEWGQVREQAEQLQADYPGWHVRPVQRRGGTGVEALRDDPGWCSVIGSAAEVRAVLADTADRRQ